jgi:phosphoribosylglycinamide formyltransferase 1
MIPRARVAILISGRGSNMAALIDAAKNSGFPAEITLVVSNKPEAEGLAVAARHGVSVFAISHKDYPDRESFDRAMDERLRRANIEWILLAGFMRVLSPWFCQQWQRRMINIHPSLLPKFKGTDTHRRAIEAGESEHGCTVHFVTPELDDGPPIMQAHVPILPGDTPEILAKRVLVEEHKIYPLALKKVLEEQMPSSIRQPVDGSHGPAR